MLSHNNQLKSNEIKISTIKRHHDYGKKRTFFDYTGNKNEFWEKVKYPDQPHTTMLCTKMFDTQQQAINYVKIIHNVEPKENHAGFYFVESQEVPGKFRVVAELSKIHAHLSEKCIEEKKRLIVHHLNLIALPTEIFKKYNQDSFSEQEWAISRDTGVIGYIAPSIYSFKRNAANQLKEIDSFLKRHPFFKGALQEDNDKRRPGYYLRNNEFLYTTALAEAQLKRQAMHSGLLAASTLGESQNGGMLPRKILFEIGLFAKASMRSLARVNKAAAEIDNKFKLK